MNKLNLKIPPAIVFLVCLILIWAINKYIPELAVIDLPGWIMTVMIITGALIAFAGLVQFAMKSTTVNPHKPDHATSLVTDGIYRFTRNPMYLGLLIILSTGVLKFGDLLGLIVLPLFVLYMNRFQIRPEERVMMEKFGDEYRDYKQKVRRWV